MTKTAEKRLVLMVITLILFSLIPKFLRQNSCFKNEAELF